MATSGTISFTRTRDQLIKAALRKCGINSVGETIEAQQIEDAAEDLNMMIKAWKAQGINLWCYQEIAIFPIVGQASYNLGATGDRAASVYFVTTLSAAAAVGSLTINLSNVSYGNFSINGWIIGVVLDSGTIQWTTINGVPTGNIVTLAASLTGSAGAANQVYVYQVQAQRPLRVSAGRVKISNGNEIPMKVISRQEYQNLPIKKTEGHPTQLYYDPQLGNGILSMWSTFETVNDFVIVTAQREIQDFNNLNDEPDLPVEWIEPIVYNLASRIALDYGVDKVTRDDINAMAQGFLDTVMWWDQEAVSITFTPMFEE